MNIHLLARPWVCAVGICTLATVLPLDVFADDAQGDSISVKEFRTAIAERDKIIIDLLRRVEELEARQKTSAPPVSAPGVVDSLPPPTDLEAASDSRVSSAAGTGRADSEGRVIVDELSAQRALERSLVATGALLLDTGQAEIDPSFLFQYDESSGATAVSVGGSTFVANRGVRRGVFDAGLTFRHGMPWGSQFEGSLPYRYVARDETTDVLGSIQSSDDTDGHGIGDLRLGMAKTIISRESGWPDLIGRITWDTGSGKRTDDGVPLGYGFAALQGEVTALYRQDPMVFLGTAGYEYSFEKDNIRLGDELQFALGTSIAISPETSISFGLDQTYSWDAEVAGRRFDGSDQFVSNFTFGASTIVWARTLLRISAGIGLTDDAADYSVGISIPIRFESPIVN